MLYSIVVKAVFLVFCMSLSCFFCKWAVCVAARGIWSRLFYERDCSACLIPESNCVLDRLAPQSILYEDFPSNWASLVLRHGLAAAQTGSNMLCFWWWFIAIWFWHFDHISRLLVCRFLGTLDLWPTGLSLSWAVARAVELGGRFSVACAQSAISWTIWSFLLFIFLVFRSLLLL